MSLNGKTVLITGAARRIGRHLALCVAEAGANVVLHHAHSPEEARQTAEMIERMGRQAWIVQADFNRPEDAEELVARASAYAPLYALVNNAAIFEARTLPQTSLADWQRHLNINLTAPFLLSREFAARLSPAEEGGDAAGDAAGNAGRIVNILDWRALRPGSDHFPYTITKAALVALTRSLAVALAPAVTVNGLALGAVLPPSDGPTPARLVESIPARRWATLDEVGQALLFLLDGPAFITGEILSLDGGRHLI